MAEWIIFGMGFIIGSSFGIIIFWGWMKYTTIEFKPKKK
jgi:hypothetical protein